LGVLLLPWLYLAAIRIWLAPRFPMTHALVDDWYQHALSSRHSCSASLVAGSARVWEAMERFAVGGARRGAGRRMRSSPVLPFPGNAPPPSEALRMVQRTIYAADQWAFIVAASGFARRYLDRDGPARRYTHRGSDLPVLHSSTRPRSSSSRSPCAASTCRPRSRRRSSIALVAAACFATYELVRRAGWLRPLFGLKRVETRGVSSAP
jgi:hypothetical protein